MTKTSCIFRMELDRPGPGTVSVVAGSAKGPHRRANEDNFIVITPEGTATFLMNEVMITGGQVKTWPDGFLRIGVADGMGGHTGGRQAAESAVMKLLHHPPFKSPEEAKQTILNIHNAMLSENGGKSGCTLLVADFDLLRHSCILINVGDSRGYFTHRGTEYPVTHDHRPCEFAWRDGEISDAEYRRMKSSKTNHLAQAMGYGSHKVFSREDDNLNNPLRIDLAGDLCASKATNADTFRLAFLPGDRLTLLSDGVLLVGDSQHAMERILELDDNPDALDNATAVVVEFLPE